MRLLQHEKHLLIQDNLRSDRFLIGFMLFNLLYSKLFQSTYVDCVIFTTMLSKTMR